MTPAERMQAVALLAGAEALRSQAAALIHLAESQVAAANALLATDAPSPEAAAASGRIFEQTDQTPPKKYFGRTPQPSGDA